METEYYCFLSGIFCFDSSMTFAPYGPSFFFSFNLSSANAVLASETRVMLVEVILHGKAAEGVGIVI